MSEEIKIDEVKYFQFLVSVKEYIKKTSKLTEDAELKEEEEWIKKFIKKQLKLRELMTTRDQSYKFYCLCKKTDIRAANASYENYIKAKAEIDKLRKEN